MAVKRARDTSGLQRDLLRKEVAMLSRLDRAGRPGLVHVMESGSDRGLLWYAMEYIEGPDLASVAQSFSTTPLDALAPPTVTVAGGSAGPNLDRAEVHEAPPGRDRDVPAFWLPPQRQLQAAGGRLSRALAIVQQLAEILRFLHGEGVVHGDVKPKNVLFRADDSPVLVDFGTALYALAGQSPREVAQVERLRNGTPGYMAPEQIRNDILDGRCDLYALGCILFELLTARRPFMADDPVALLNQHLHLSPPRPSSLVEGVPPDIDDLVVNLLAKDPRDRVGYAEDVVEVLSSGASRHLSSPRHLYRPRMTGRSGALERLISHLPGNQRGPGAVVYVSGESGIGKTRLVNELGGHAIGLDMEVVIAHSADIGHSVGSIAAARGRALQSFVPLLHRLFDRCSLPSGAALLDDLQIPLSILAPYEPTLAELPQVSRHRPSALPHALGRARVFRSLVEVIRRFSQIRPLLLVIDDLHWADDLSLAFLQSPNVRELRDAPVLIVGTYRFEQVDESLRRVAEADPDSLISLDRLGADALHAMVKDMLASSIAPEGLVAYLHRHSEGNPFFTAEYLNAAIGRGLLVRGTDRRWHASAPLTSTGDDLSRLDLPASLHELLAARLEGLSDGANALLELAAILGREFDLDLLQSLDAPGNAGGLGTDALALEELVARKILEESGWRRYRFVHDKLRESAQARVAGDRQRYLHGIIAQRLESLPRSPAELERHDGEVGIHWAHAGDRDRALPYLHRAARTAERMHANRRAAELYMLAISQCGGAGADGASHATQRALAESLADVLVRMARHKEARGHYEQALALVPRTERLDRARLARKKAHSYWTVHEYDEARRALMEALLELGRPGPSATTADWREWLEVQQGRFWCEYFARRTGQTTQAIIHEMAEVVDVHGAAEQRAVYHICAALDGLGRTRYRFSEEAVAHTRRALEVSEGDAAHAAEAALARFNLGFALLLGDRRHCEEAVGLLGHAVAEAERLGDATILARALTYRTVGYRRLGDVAVTEAAARSASRAAEDAQLPPYLGATLACLAWATWKKGAVEQAYAMALEAKQWWTRGGHAFPFHWLADLLLLDASVRRDDVQGVRTALADLLNPQQQQLPDALDSALQAAKERLGDTLDRPSIRALDDVFAIARQLGYL